jgi:hypothetical protein
MDVRKPDPGIRRPDRDHESSNFQVRVRFALDIALIVAMAAAPFLLVGSQLDDAEMPSTQLAQLPAP